MSEKTLTYRGVPYVKETNWLLNARLRAQREEFEKKLNQLRMKKQVV